MTPSAGPGRCWVSSQRPYAWRTRAVSAPPIPLSRALLAAVRRPSTVNRVIWVSSLTRPTTPSPSGTSRVRPLGPWAERI